MALTERRRAHQTEQPRANPPTIECRGLCKHFGGVRVIDGLDASFSEGKVTALVGPNGAGKTTLFHLIGGTLHPDAGEILLQGNCIQGLPPWRVAARGVGRLFQDVRVFANLTVLENAVIGLSNTLAEGPFAAWVAYPVVSRHERTARGFAEHWLEFVGLADFRHRRAEELSYGQQKLLGMARLLTAGAQVLLLDEPTAGISPGMVADVLRLVRKLAADGRTVVVIEHNMNVVIEHADWILFMADGRVTACGLPSEVLADPDIQAAYLGL